MAPTSRGRCEARDEWAACSIVFAPMASHGSRAFTLRLFRSLPGHSGMPCSGPRLRLQSGGDWPDSSGILAQSHVWQSRLIDSRGPSRRGWPKHLRVASAWALSFLIAWRIPGERLQGDQWGPPCLRGLAPGVTAPLPRSLVSHSSHRGPLGFKERAHRPPLYGTDISGMWLAGCAGWDVSWWLSSDGRMHRKHAEQGPAGAEHAVGERCGDGYCCCCRHCCGCSSHYC